MPKVKVWIHFVLIIKSDSTNLSEAHRKLLAKQIQQIAGTHKIKIEVVNCLPDHLHCLVLLNETQSVGGVYDILTTNSAEWMNFTKVVQQFEWDTEYLAVSISESMFDKTKEYILNQEIIHVKKAFEVEFNEFIQKYEFEKIRTYSIN